VQVLALLLRKFVLDITEFLSDLFIFIFVSVEIVLVLCFRSTSVSALKVLVSFFFLPVFLRVFFTKTVAEMSEAIKIAAPSRRKESHTDQEQLSSSYEALTKSLQLGTPKIVEKTYLIGLTGGTASGKTTLAKEICGQLDKR
jgi:hypothetical protein